MARNQFTIHGDAVYIAADDDQRKRVTLSGDPVSYGASDVKHNDRQGSLEEGSVVLSTGRWFVSEGTTSVTVEDTDDRPRITPPADRSAQRKASKSGKKSKK